MPIGLQVICCSAARSTITADLSRVEEKGVANLAAAFLDAQNAAARQQGKLAAAAKREVVDFADADYHEAWDITAVGVPALGEQLCCAVLCCATAIRQLRSISPCLFALPETSLPLLPSLLPRTLTHAPTASPPRLPSEESGDSKPKARRRAAERMRARDNAECYINDDDNLVFEGRHDPSTSLPDAAGRFAWDAWDAWGGSFCGRPGCGPAVWPQHSPFPCPCLALFPAQARCTPATAWPRWAPSSR